jgi:hypothetical protein
MQPLTDRRGLVDLRQAQEHLRLIFGDRDWKENEFICVRGIGEKGTDQEGVFREDIFVEPATEGFTPVLSATERWAQYNVATFVVPGILSDRRATSANVARMRSLVADLDNGNTDEKMRAITEQLGEPSLVVLSGGTTEEGTPKRHVWYQLDGEIPAEQAIRMRDALAKVSGGDSAMGLGVDSNPYGRAHQPIRLAGSVHAKKGTPVQTAIEWRSETVQNAAAFTERLRSLLPQGSIAPEAGLFGANSTNALPKEPAHQRDVYEGAANGETRWDAFNSVAGANLGLVRRGMITLEEAREQTRGWMLQRMHPAWTDARFASEWQGLVNADTRRNGKVDAAPAAVQAAPRALPASTPAESWFEAWQAHRWIKWPKPEHTYLVEALVVKGEPHLFIAEGGAGKTGLIADLALKVAAQPEYAGDLDWCGQRITNGGTAVLLLCEDSQTEMHRRILEIDHGGLITKAGRRLVVIPLSAVGGAFPLVERDPKSGSPIASPKWEAIITELKRIPDLCLVAIDTFNAVSHGDENNALAVAEMMREAGRVCGELKAALMITHHIRKPGNEPIRTLKDMKNSIRGSSAIPSYFRINLGFWHATDYERRMKGMSLAPRVDSCYRFGVLKANISGLMRGERTLLRDGNGLLKDVTKLDVYSAINVTERLAWLVLAVREAAGNLHPYTLGNKNAANGLYKRRSELPPVLRAVGASEFGHLIEEGLQKELIVSCAVKGSKAKSYLDVPGGLLASDETGAAIQAGAYSSLPDWSEYMFDPETGTCVGRSAAGAWGSTFSQPSMAASAQSGREQEDQPVREELAEEHGEPAVPAFRSQFAREIRIGLPRAEKLASQDEE